MIGDRYTILKSYKVFERDAIGEPMDEMTQDKLHDWLRVRLCCADEQATSIINKVDQYGSAEITLP